MPKFNERGAIPLLVLIAALGLVAFLAFSNTFSFKDKLFSEMFPKSPSLATTNDISNSKLAENAKVKTDNVLRLAKDYNNASADKKLGLLVDLKKAAIDRKASMLTLIDKNRQAFLQYSIPTDTKKTFPQEIQPDIEGGISLEGNMQNYLSGTYDEEKKSAQFKVVTFLGQGQNRLYLHLSDGEISQNLGPGVPAKIKGIKMNYPAAS